jgi:hypothetical protein
MDSTSRIEGIVIVVACCELPVLFIGDHDEATAFCGEIESKSKQVFPPLVGKRSNVSELFHISPKI